MEQKHLYLKLQHQLYKVILKHLTKKFEKSHPISSEFELLYLEDQASKLSLLVLTEFLHLQTDFKNLKITPLSEILKSKGLEISEEELKEGA